MKLDKENLIEIIKKSVSNARSLYNDAIILKESGRIERAYTLFQLSTEESGKSLLTFGFLFFDNYEDASMQKQFLKEFRDHQAKTTKAMNLDTMIADSFDDSSTRKGLHDFFYQRYNEVPLMNERKNHSLYVSINDGKVIQPSDIITLDLVNEIQLWANFRCVGVEKLMALALSNVDELMAACKALDKQKIISERIRTLKDEFN